jgi:hypothetical protein
MDSALPRPSYGTAVQSTLRHLSREMSRSGGAVGLSTTIDTYTTFVHGDDRSELRAVGCKIRLLPRNRTSFAALTFTPSDRKRAMAIGSSLKIASLMLLCCCACWLPSTRPSAASGFSMYISRWSSDEHTRSACAVVPLLLMCCVMQISRSAAGLEAHRKIQNPRCDRSGRFHACMRQLHQVRGAFPGRNLVRARLPGRGASLVSEMWGCVGTPCAGARAVNIGLVT